MLASSRASPYAYNKCFLCRRMYVCMWEHADVMGQLLAPVSLGGETQALRNAYQLQEFRWKQIVTSPDAPFTRGERSTGFFSLAMCEDWPISWGRAGRCCVQQKGFSRQVGLESQLNWLAPLHSSASPEVLCSNPKRLDEGCLPLTALHISASGQGSVEGSEVSLLALPAVFPAFAGRRQGYSRWKYSSNAIPVVISSTWA